MKQLLDERTGPIRHSVWSLLSLLVLALAVAAKLYPVILAPLLILPVLRRFGWQRVMAASAIFAIVTAVVCWPMLEGKRTDASRPRATTDQTENTPPLPPGVETTSLTNETAIDGEPGAGLEAFLSRWKMNDFLFLILIENLNPTTDVPAEQRPWFVVTNNNGDGI